MNNLQELRKAKNITQDQLAGRLHIYQYRISQLENGKTQFKTEELIKLAKFFNVTIDYLLGIKHPSDNLQGITDKEIDIVKALRVISKEDREYIEGLIEGFVLRR